MKQMFNWPMGAPVTTSMIVAVISTGVALGLLVAFLRCRTHCKTNPRAPRITLGQRIATLAWSVGAGVVTTISGHWVLTTGIADRVIAWMTAVWRIGAI
jgi:hypothetical protein